ncbi:Chitinase A [Vibrio nigripulchritudo MADA3029]|uniref:glycosyl hydrolase family 18 protein n=1 Tax=Vibrio nigripulchritudo TaxID=28173 RepID=UPI0003B183C6|nr:glycosyl hydrolase family 18 protein [Vibrio nigripulchritudo]CCN46945.1 Chitinase A [Vibrio nigripulchritudo MADA3020]CCN54764.1 Chitinase A [Vibrio nigripulchritudo MADA3021]CCN60631.1 Chitinase A [Vibrio nigripulchritudo MADA3029]
MKHLSLCAIGVGLALSGSALAAPAAPTIDLDGSNNLKFSKIQLEMQTLKGYHQMVSYKDLADITIKFNQWSGTTGDTYKIYFDGVEVATGPITGSTTTAAFQYGKGGLYSVEVAACDATGCSKSAPQELVVADTDGAHLKPLAMNVDPNNKTYNTDPNTVVGTYFVEWGIYGRDFTVDNIPVDNLTHILYGFIPICGQNDSLLKDNPSGHRMLQTLCTGVNDYEVVVHDPWAAFMKGFDQAGHQYADPIKGNYAMLMALKQRNPDLKIVPSIGGWTLSDPFHGFTQKANRDIFVASVKKFLKTWKFYDGVDIDWEFPGGGGPNGNLGDPVNDGPAYVALMQELRTMLNELEVETGRTYELTSAIGVGYDKLEDVDYAAAVQHMDYIFAMTYDFYGAWSNNPGHQTALYCGNFMRPGQCDGTGTDANGEPYKGPAYTTDNAIKILLGQGVPANKLVVGTAMYGRGWDGVMPGTLTDPTDPMTGTGTGALTGTEAQGVWQDGVIDYKGIKANMLGANNQGINGFEYGYDELAEAPYVWNRSNGKLITFDDERSVKAKGAYVRSLGLAGLFSWEIDADNGDILNAMHEGLATIGGNRAPIASAGADVAVEGPAQVTLDASASKDLDGTIASYAWKQVTGPAVTITSANAAVATVDFASVTAAQTYTFEVTVTDNKGAASTDKVLVTVSPKGVNSAPVAAVSAPAQAAAGDVVVVDASGSTDADNDTLTYTWDVPAGVNATVQGAKVTFTAASYDVDTTLNFSVIVSDGKASSSAQAAVVVKKNVVDPTCDVTGINVYPNWPQTDWAGNPNHAKAGDQMVHNGVIYEANWYTTTVPGSDGSWSTICTVAK